MRKRLLRSIGIVFVAAGGIGILLSLLALIGVWTLVPRVARGVDTNLAVLDTTLITTTQGLVVISQTLVSTSENIAALQSGAETMRGSLERTGPMLNTLVTMTGSDLPNTITNTQRALTSAQASARLIDNVLGAVTALPLPGLQPYRPQVPLNQALAQVSTSLNPLPASLKTIHTSLQGAQNDLISMQTELNTMSNDFRRIGDNVAEAQLVVGEYQQAVGQLQDQVGQLRHSAPNWILATAWLFSFLLLWVLISQVGFILQGLAYMGVEL